VPRQIAKGWLGKALGPRWGPAQRPGSSSALATPPPARAPAQAARDDSLPPRPDIDLLVLHDYVLPASCLELLERQATGLVDLEHARRAFFSRARSTGGS
jgi:hypothetical protein